MKVVLANSIPSEGLPKYYYDTTYPCLGLLYIAGTLKRNFPDLEIKYLEADYTPEGLIEILSSYRPEIFGMYIPTDASRMSYRLINEVKTKFPSIHVVTGGPHPTAMPEEVLKESLADVVCIGEGEKTMSEIVRHRMEGSNALHEIEGIAYRRDGTIERTNSRKYIPDIDSIPWPLWDLIDIQQYKGRQFRKAKTKAGVLATRGCPFNCTFCSNPVWKVDKPWLRMRSPRGVAEEIEYLYQKGARDIYVRTDELNCNLKWAIQVCEEIARLGHKDLYLSANLRVDKLPDELAKALKEANFWIVFLGVESANNRVLKGIGKMITVEDAENAFKALRKFGILVSANFMMYNIWEENGKLCYETPEEVDNTYRFVKRCIQDRLIDYIAWSITTPYPGSRLWDLNEKHHFMRGDRFNKGALQVTTQLPGISESQIVRSRRKFQLLQAYLALRNGNIEWRLLGRMIDRIKYLFSWT